ncbi:MAG: bis-aminopropyl spermidine synthase family protein [bacterium]|nr:bis-aminopropyl spermidine synthase family protein [bacterium]
MDQKDISEQFKILTKKTGLPLKKIADFFYYLQMHKKLENNELVGMVGVARNVLNEIKKTCYFWFNTSSSTTSLSGEGFLMMQGSFSDQYIPEEKILTIFSDSQFLLFKSLLEKKRLPRLGSNRNLDQFLATTETITRRAVIMDFFEDLEGKRILFLGDDDFTSVALSLIRKADSIRVLEIDERIVGNIEKVSKEGNPTIRVERYDAREVLPKEYQDQFDVIFTDPPYTPAGVKLFLSRAIQALDKTNKSARIYLCFGSSDAAKERLLPIQEILVNSGLMLRWAFDKFNRYESGAEAIGNASSLYILDITPKAKPPISGSFKEPIYTHLK